MPPAGPHKHLWADIPKKPGIYRIRHKASGMFYIGSGKLLRHRIRSHIYEFMKNKHHSARMQRIWNKEGPDAFVFEVVEAWETYDGVLARETQLIAETRATERSVGFNTCVEARSPLGRRWTESQRAKMVKYPEARLRAWAAERESGMTLRAISERDGVCPHYISKMTRPYMSIVQSRTTVTKMMKRGFLIWFCMDIPIKKIADHFNVDKKVVYDSLGDKITPAYKKISRARAAQKLSLAPEKIRQIHALSKEHLSFREIGRRVGCGHHAVMKYVKRNESHA